MSNVKVIGGLKLLRLHIVFFEIVFSVVGSIFLNKLPQNDQLKYLPTALNFHNLAAPN